jgi:2-iminobutanoate/2-iminopropanoate deaminase
MRRPVSSALAPAPAGPYAQGIVAAGPFVFLSGQLPFDASTGALVGPTFAVQAARVFDQLGHLLSSAGSSWSQVVRLGVFLADLRDYAELNEISRRYVVTPYPARTCAQSLLPPGVLLEVDCIAQVGA